MNFFRIDFDKGFFVDEKERVESFFKMFLIYVRVIFDGIESGDFLVFDLGGINFRVLLIFIYLGGEVKMVSDIYFLD